MDLNLIFNDYAENYDKYRPCYPIELTYDIINYGGLSSGDRLLEIGIGTGQATQPFLNMGCDVVGIDIGDKLSEYVATKYKSYNNFSVINNDFIKQPFTSSSFNLIYSATAFHWLKTTTSYKKIYDLLKPEGTVALFWNHPFVNRKKDVSNIASEAVYDKYRPSGVKIKEFSKDDCVLKVTEIKQAGFSDVKYHLYKRKRTLKTEDYIGLLNTYSDHLSLNHTLKLQFENDMRKAINSVGGKINIYDTLDLYLGRKL